MTGRSTAPHALFVLATAVGLTLIGCRPAPVADAPGYTNLQTLARLYGQHVSMNRGRAPANLEEFKRWVQKHGQVDPGSFDALFVSPRDREPFGFVFGAVPLAPGPDGKGAVIIYEQKGVNGKRMVAYSTTQIEEVDEATFTRLVPRKP